MKTDNNSLNNSKNISQAVIDFHKKVSKYLEGRSMIDGYTVTIRDAMETANFINSFSEPLGLNRAIILGIGRQYISKLKNEDKSEIIAALKEIDFAALSDSEEELDVEQILYLGGKYSRSNLTEILGATEDEQLGNLFRILTRMAPKIIEHEIDIVQQMLLSNEKNVLVSAITTLSFLPDKVNKVIIELGMNIYCDEPEVYLQLLTLAEGIDDEPWKKQIIENEILPRLLNETDDKLCDIRIETIKILSGGISDNNWKRGIIEDELLQKLSNLEVTVRTAAAGAIGALSTNTGNEEWKKDVIEVHLFPLATDSVGEVASWSVKAIGMLSIGLTDNDWKRRTVKNSLIPKIYDKKEKVRVAAIETIGTFITKINSFSFINEFVRDYLLEKLFDERNIQVAVMNTMENIFYAVEKEDWKKDIIENDLLPRLEDRREFQTVVISKFHDLLYYIDDSEWKLKVIEDSLIKKLNSQDWYIHSETLKMLGSLNKCFDDGELKKKIIEEHFIPRLAFRDKDIQASAAFAIGALAHCNGSEQWRKAILEDHLLPKSLNERDFGVSMNVFKSIGKIAAGIDDLQWRQKIVDDYLVKGLTNMEGFNPSAADAICNIISLQLNKNNKEGAENFLNNLKDYLHENSSTLSEGSFDDKIIETTDDVTIGRFTLKKNRSDNPYIPDGKESKLVNTKTTVEDMEFLAASVSIGKPVLEIGPTATRKSALIQYLAFLTNTPYIRFNLNGQTDKYEFIGGYKPQSSSINLAEAEAIINRTIDDGEYETIVSVVTRLTGKKYGKFEAMEFIRHALKEANQNIMLNSAALILDSDCRLEWQDGILIDALKYGCYLNLDELNLSESDVLERINPLLDDEGSLVVYEHKNEKYINEHGYNELIARYTDSETAKTREQAIEYLSEKGIFKIDKNFRLFATMNPKEYKGRNKLSDPFLNRWRILRIEELPDAELAEIMNARYHTPSELVMPMVLFHQSIRDQTEKGVLGKRQREEYHFTIRDLIRVFGRIESSVNVYKAEHQNNPDTETINIFMAEAVDEVYGMVFRDEEDRNKYSDFYKKAFGDITIPAEKLSTNELREKYINTNEAETVTFGKNNRVHITRFTKNQSPNIPGKKAILTPVKTTLQYIKTIVRSLKLYEPIHLVGPTASAKTSIIRYLAYLTNSGFQRVSLAGQTDTADIMGQYQSTLIRGQYAWKDGTLLQAMKDGDYLLLDELNLAEPQILERINSLLDTGRIVISEHNNETYVSAELYDKMVTEGKIEAMNRSFVKIHENFRVIAASNPVDIRNQGRTRLSLAFRNRFRELWMEEINDNEELVEIVNNVLTEI